MARSTKPSARQANREEKRRRIIDAAVEVFADKGLHSAKIADIAKIAGVADGTIYLYFKGKDDLMISLFQEKMAMILSQLNALVNADDDPETKLKNYIRQHLALVAAQPKLMQVLTVELRQSARFMRDIAHQMPFGRYLAMLSSIIEDGQKRGVFRKDVSPLLVSRSMFGALDEMALSWVLHENTRARIGSERTVFDRAAVADQLSDFFLRGLREER